MALSLNTGHSLYGNLLALIGVDDDNVVKDLKGNQTCTKDAACTIQTGGAFGRAFRTTFTSGDAKGVALSPGIVLGSGAKSVFIVTNAINSLSGSRYMAVSCMSAVGWSPSVSAAYYPRLYSVDGGVVQTGSAAINAGGHSWGACADRTGNQTKTFADGAIVGSGNANGSGYGSSTAQTYIGGETSGQYGGVAADYVWVAFFDKYLSDAEIAALHASLGANNAFALIASAAVNATAPGATLAGSSTLTAGAATGTGTATAPGATLTGASTLATGTASGGTAGTFTSDAMENNTGAGLLANTAVAWTWVQGSIGAAPTSLTYGSGTTNASGILSLTGLPLGAGFLLVRTLDGSGVYYQPGTVA